MASTRGYSRTGENGTSSAGRITTNGQWMACLVINTFTILCQVYMIVRFAMFVSRRIRMKRRFDDANILKSALVAVILPIPRLLCSLAVILVSLQEKNDNGCEIAMDIDKVSFIVAVLFIYGFFWLRQRAFYRHPSLKMTFGTGPGILSKASICILTLIAVVLTPLSVFPLEYEASERGCVVRNGEKVYSFRDYLYSASMLFGQCILLGLFLYPLWIHSKTQKRITKPGKQPNNPSKISTTMTNLETGNLSSELTTSEKPSETKRHTISSSKDEVSIEVSKNSHVESDLKVVKTPKGRTQPRAPVFALIKRTLLVALTAVFTDLLVLITVRVLLAEDAPLFVSRAVYDSDLFINGATVLLSFENWAEIILPFKIPLRKHPVHAV